MRMVTIIYCDDVPEVKKEAEEMAEFLRENDVPCMLCGFYHATGEVGHWLQEMAYVTPLIRQPMIPARHPADTYVKGLEGAKKHIKLIKKWVHRH